MRAGVGVVDLAGHLRGGRALEEIWGANGAVLREEGNQKVDKCLGKGEGAEGTEVWRGLPSKESIR